MKWILSLVLALGLTFCQAQDQKMAPEDRWVFGGNVALGFSNNLTIIGANPTVGYRLTERLTLGAGAAYYYQRFLNQSTSIYGPQAFGRFLLAQDLLGAGDRLFLQSDYYYISNEAYNFFNEEYERIWVPQWFVGGGYYTQLSGRLFAGIIVMWDLIDDRRAAFPNPLIRGGVSIGL